MPELDLEEFERCVAWQAWTDLEGNPLVRARGTQDPGFLPTASTQYDFISYYFT